MATGLQDVLTVDKCAMSDAKCLEAGVGVVEVGIGSVAFHTDA